MFYISTHIKLFRFSHWSQITPSQNICLVATHSARNRSFIVDEPLRYSFTKYHELSSNLVGLTFVIFAVSVSISILKHSAVPSLHHRSLQSWLL